MGARVRLGSQVKGGPTKGENPLAPRTPGSEARHPEPRARAGEGEATHRRRRIAESSRRTLTWALDVARGRGRGLLAGASVFLLALSLASAFFALGHLAGAVHTLRGRLRGKTTRDKFGPRAWIGFGKSLSLVGESNRAAALAQCRGRLLSPVESGADPACGLGHLGLVVSSSEGRPGSWGCSCRPGKSAVVPAAQGPAAIGSCPGLCPARLQPEEGEEFTVLPALSSPRQPLPLCSCPPHYPGVRTSFGELLAGSFSIAPQPPTSRPQVGGWRLLLTLPSLAPSLFPTTPPLQGADTPPGGAWALRSWAQPLSLPEPGLAGGGRRCAQRLQGTPNRGRWNLLGDAAATAAAGTKTSGPGEIQGLRRGPRDSCSLLS